MKPVASRSRESGLPHRHGHWFFALALLVAVGGFFPSFLARLGETDGPHLLHGTTAFAWMVLLILQSWLVHHGHRPAHRALGRWSWLLVLPMLVGATLMLRSMLASEAPVYRKFGPTLAFIDITTIAYFVAAYVLALVHRRKVHLHARLMASTVVLVLPPALARLLPGIVPLITSFSQSLHVSLFLTEAVALLLVLRDWRGGRVHPPYVALLVFLVLQHAALLWIPRTVFWLDLCRWIAGHG